MSSSRSVIVTGATGGIGRAIAHRLRDAGYDLVLVSRNIDDAWVEQQFAESDSQIIAIAGDLRDESFCESVVGDTVKAFGHLSGLVNNAGITDDGFA